VYVSIVPKDLDDTVKDGPTGSLWGLVILSGDEDMTVDCSWGEVEDIQGGIPCLAVIVKDLYGDAEQLPSSFLFFFTVICLISGVKH
jgi:hypothetical protein